MKKWPLFPAMPRLEGGPLFLILFLLAMSALKPAAAESPAAADQQQAKVTAFYYSNWRIYAQDYFLYHPIKAFDGNPLTAWLEHSPGPGIDDYIGLVLAGEVTFDSIEIMPGFFDARWHKNNNRVKLLQVQADGRLYNIICQDRMKKQRAVFQSPITCKSIVFFIKEVYASGMDDNTAISEIGLYYRGEEIRLDLSPVNRYLKKVTEKQLFGSIR